MEGGREERRWEEWTDGDESVIVWADECSCILMARVLIRQR